jgi:hypothetical protein
MNQMSRDRLWVIEVGHSQMLANLAQAEFSDGGIVLKVDVEKLGTLVIRVRHAEEDE